MCLTNQDIQHMKKIFILFSINILFILAFNSCSVRDVASESKPVSHEIWNDILSRNVTDDGWVNYKGIKEESDNFYTYLDILNKNHPNHKNWTSDERLAYWINAYNAYTVQIIIENYPIESIKDIKKGIPFVNTVWDIKFIKIEGIEYDLNNIEHSILRKKFEEPRIHFAVNCASYSCPVLRGEAFVAERIDEQLTEQARLFLADKRRNIVTEDKAQLSKIFSWFGGDFKKNGSKLDFINKYSPVQIKKTADISYLDYNWTLNEPQ